MGQGPEGQPLGKGMRMSSFGVVGSAGCQKAGIAPLWSQVSYLPGFSDAGFRGGMGESTARNSCLCEEWRFPKGGKSETSIELKRHWTSFL